MRIVIVFALLPVVLSGCPDANCERTASYYCSPLQVSAPVVVSASGAWYLQPQSFSGGLAMDSDGLPPTGLRADGKLEMEFAALAGTCANGGAAGACNWMWFGFDWQNTPHDGDKAVLEHGAVTSGQGTVTGSLCVPIESGRSRPSPSDYVCGTHYVADSGTLDIEEASSDAFKVTFSMTYLPDPKYVDLLTSNGLREDWVRVEGEVGCAVKHYLQNDCD